MQVTVASDLHLEISLQDDLPDMGEGEILLLVGDILNVGETQAHRTDKESVRFRKKYCEFFNGLKYDQVFLIPGNHEYYGMDLGHKTDQILHKFLQSFSKNFHVLNDKFIEVDDTVIVGSTLWTDCGISIGQEVAIQHLMNDFSKIKVESVDWRNRKLTPMTVNAFHISSKEFLQRCLKTFINRKVIVATHHAPLLDVGKGTWQDYAYCSDQSGLMLDYIPNIWAYGHTHQLEDLWVDNTHVISNPRGYYGKDDILAFDPQRFSFNTEDL